MSKRRFRAGIGLRLINALATAAARRGIGPSQRYLLTVTGRSSKLPHTTPVSIVFDGGGRYLVSPYGEVGWVKNVRVSPLVTLSRAEKTRTSRWSRCRCLRQDQSCDATFGWSR